MLYTTFPEVGTAAERAGFDAVRERVRLTRYGFDCYAYALIALGQVDLVIEAGLAALRHPGAAGGDRGGGRRRHRLAGRAGAPGGRVLAAGDARVHAAALEILAEVRD